MTGADGNADEAAVEVFLVAVAFLFACPTAVNSTNKNKPIIPRTEIRIIRSQHAKSWETLSEIKIKRTFNPALSSWATSYRMVSISTGPAHGWDVDFQAADAITLNGQPFAWQVSELGNGHYQLLYKDRAYTAEVLAADYTTKTFSLKINGQRIELQAKDQLDKLLDRLGLSNAAAAKVNELKAPMPGLIVEVRVQPGQAVQKGDPLLVLEAMKMENILKAPADGVVASIKVATRDNVTKGQVLVQFA